MVIDVTYRCNSRCSYCRWGNPSTPGRTDQSNEQVYLGDDILKNLNVTRIVLSGGEPLLRNDLDKIILHYSNLGIRSIVTLTNGLLVTEKRIENLISNGLTGITFSIDGFNNTVFSDARGLNISQAKLVKKNLEMVLSTFRETPLEVSINTVLSKANISSLVEFLAELNTLPIDWIKFQPVFDDGYVGVNSPDLLLNKEDIVYIRQIQEYITREFAVQTNPSQFWSDIIDVLDGSELDGSYCGLDRRQSLVINDEIKFCFWIDDPIYYSSLGKSADSATNPERIVELQDRFTQIKSSCKTGMQCFCLQSLNHVWREVNEDS